MTVNYLKYAFRSLRSNRLFTALNIAGLAIGLAAGILVMLWISDELQYNKFIPKLDQVHLILQNQRRDGVTLTFNSTPGPLAAALRTEIPEVVAAARTSWTGEHLMLYHDKAVYERGCYAEPDFFKVFQLRVIQGNPEAALSESDGTVITERTARKFFGDENPIGKIVKINNIHNLKVGAVVADVPSTSTIKFDVLLPFRLYEQDNSDWVNSSWGNNAVPTYTLLQPGANLADLNNKLENFIQARNDDSQSHIFAYPLDQYRLYGKFENGKPNGGRADMLQMLGLIGVFVLLIACINFMNLSTARSEKRAREVGVRKSLGAQRSSLIGQFLSESMLLTFFSLLLALVLAQLVLPSFNRVLEKTVSFSTLPASLWAGVLALWCVTGIVAGSYPAFFLSRFQPVKVLKGGSVIPGKGSGMFRRGLVTFQFLISIFLIISTIVIYRQMQHAQNRPIGYDQELLVEIPARGDMGKQYTATKNDLMQLPGVRSVSTASENMVRMGSNTSGIQWPGRTDDQNFLVTLMWVGYDWSKTMGAPIVQGRDFDPAFGSDSMSCILNETAVRRMGLKEPVIGTRLQYDTTLTVIGVVQDFLFNDPFGTPAPMLILFDGAGMSSMFVRLDNNSNWRESLAQVEQTVKKHNPAYPVEAQFTHDAYQEQFEGIRSGGVMASLFGGLAIFISCLGLFGLSAFTAERRQKEIGVRKVLGASIAHVLLQLSKDFLKPVVLAFVLSAPLAFFAMQKLLTEFDYRIELQWWMFAIAAALVVVIAAVTVSYQSLKAALVNPVQSLRNE